MRYLGGKSKLAKQIVEALTLEIGYAPIWEPFCGGCSVTVELARSGRHVLVSDDCAPLITMWQAVQNGWIPPNQVSEHDYERAKVLADTDPLKAFIGFGCSFGGKWFGGYARGGFNGADPRNHAQESCGAVIRDARQLETVTFVCTNFLDSSVIALLDRASIYCDPPYYGTTGYGREFDHKLFWLKCQLYVALGVRVFVSEFACPVKHRVLWSKQRRVKVDRAWSKKLCSEMLFEIL